MPGLLGPSPRSHIIPLSLHCIGQSIRRAAKIQGMGNRLQIFLGGVIMSHTGTHTGMGRIMYMGMGRNRNIYNIPKERTVKYLERYQSKSLHWKMELKTCYETYECKRKAQWEIKLTIEARTPWPPLLDFLIFQDHYQQIPSLTA